MRILPILTALIALSACTTQASAPPQSAAQAMPVEQRAPVTILVSIDAFRPDYLRKGNTPNLDALAASGVQGEMRPSFPALTFSNHEAMITGLRPDRNGVVAGVMYDPRRPGVRFANNEPTQATDPFWWGEAEPLWITAEKAGVRSGVMFWPGVEADHDGVRPGDWARYDANYLGAQRIRTMIDWMRRPADIRPGFGMIYLDVVDKTGHKHGPEAPETIAAVRDADRWIGELAAGLRALGQPANLVIVSDHGMSDIDPARAVLLDSLIPKDSYRWAQWGPFAGIDALPGREAEVAAGLLKPHKGFECWRKADVPARFHYGQNPRVAQFICLAERGAEIVPVPPTNKGDHAYDPDDSEMTAMFLMNGPALKTGAKAPRKFDNVHVYALLRHLIGLGEATNVDGSERTFDGMLKE